MVKCVCVVCKSGYKSCSDKVHFFIVPKDAGANLHKGNIGNWPGQRLKEGGKNEGLCAFFFKILKYKFSILENQNKKNKNKSLLGNLE